jgi:hypothetical protein
LNAACKCSQYADRALQTKDEDRLLKYWKRHTQNKTSKPCLLHTSCVTESGNKLHRKQCLKLQTWKSSRMWRNHCSYEPAASENCTNRTFIQFLCEYLRHLIFTSRRSNNADARRRPIEKQWIHPLPFCTKAPSHKAEINCTKNKA